MVHPASPIIDFYPIDFRADQRQEVLVAGDRNLPFIDAARLRFSLAPPKLSPRRG